MFLGNVPTAETYRRGRGDFCGFDRAGKLFLTGLFTSIKYGILHTLFAKHTVIETKVSRSLCGPAFAGRLVRNMPPRGNSKRDNHPRKLTHYATDLNYFIISMPTYLFCAVQPGYRLTHVCDMG